MIWWWPWRLLLAKCAKYFQTQMANGIIPFDFAWFGRFFFSFLVRVRCIRRSREQKQTTFRSVDMVMRLWVQANRWCLVLSCHKSGTSFRFLMILFLRCVCVSSVRWPGAHFFNDSFVYDRNIHLTTSFWWQQQWRRCTRNRWWRFFSSSSSVVHIQFVAALVMNQMNVECAAKSAKRIRAKRMN